MPGSWVGEPPFKNTSSGEMVSEQYMITYKYPGAQSHQVSSLTLFRSGAGSTFVGLDRQLCSENLLNNEERWSSSIALHKEAKILLTWAETHLASIRVKYVTYKWTS